MPEGQFLLTSLPNVLTCSLPIEPWRPAERSDAEGITKNSWWGRKKVMSDIRDHTALSFNLAQKERWAALDHFHDTYPTSDSLPALPIRLAPHGGTRPWVMQHGIPLDWRSAWADLTLRFSRCDAIPKSSDIMIVCVYIRMYICMAVHM